MQMRDYFLNLARYHVWATDKLLVQVNTMTEQHYREDCGLFFKSVHGTLNHLLVADHHWYARFSEGVSLKLSLDHELEQDREVLAQTLLTATKRWGTWLAKMNENMQDEPLRYTRVSGAEVISPYCPTLAHVFNHGTHHRGQITAILTARGYQSPEMDMIYMLLEESK